MSVTSLDVEKVRNGHRFENWTPIMEFEKRQIWEVEKRTYV
jgi:hypothetical protein